MTERILDDIDWTLLEMLQDDARLGYSELGRRVGLTPPAAADRVRRLEETGVIIGYHAAIDPSKVGLALRAIIRLGPAGPGLCQRLPEAVADRPEVLSCHRLTGHDCYQIEALVRDVPHLTQVLDALMDTATAITSIVLETPIARATVTRELTAPTNG